MDNQTIISEFLKRPIAFQPVIAKAFGSVKLGILWSQLYYWRDKTTNPEGWIYKTRQDIFEETALSRKEQENARKLGRDLGVIEEKLAGRPATVHFRVNMPASFKLISEYLENKDKVKKVEPEAAIPTPSDEMRNFIKDPDPSIKLFVEKGVPEDKVRLEVKKFISHWTEKSLSGRRQRWEMEKAFEVNRRLATWFRNSAQWKKDFAKPKKRYYRDMEVREYRGKLWCLPNDGGPWLEFNGDKRDIKEL